LGAIMAMVTKLGLTKITRDSKKCTNCKSCDRNCPMNVDISKVKFVNSTECINCNTCISQCPTKALSLNVKSKTISSNWYAILMILVFFSVIGISMMFGIWKSSNTLDLSNSTVLKAEDLRGWMTLNDVSQGTRIPLTVLYSGMNLSSDVNSSMQLKEIASKYNITNFETESVRTFLITYQGETQ
jgi:polyferredoxin